ncbi:137ba4da-f70a-4354-b272-eacfd7aad7d4 [Sclerotinia trifoliorum]|uniref:137ba4da-f70a-4354-b272-eacfd7aad7d4 n=1 Tax=Sclerotinia trifoliorum TaxID=28548 RepID=A0A8H2ZNZ3_9HELO|nr:137ba4da-f70a-4354-b272-eacfd7aad7d4 [Sclerotinia trifoliorum]
MPEGAILRAHHFSSCLLISLMIKLVEIPGMFISATNSLDTYWVGKEKKIKMEFVHNNSQVRECFTTSFYQTRELLHLDQR